MALKAIVLYVAVVVAHHLTSAATRYLPSPPSSSSSSSPWVSVSSTLYAPSLLSAVLLPKSDDRHRAEEAAQKILPSSKLSSELASRALQRDLMRLSRLLPGVYTNMQQYRQEAGRSLPNQKRHILLRSSYRPITLRFLPRSFAVLVQDYSGDSLFPFRQRVYTFSLDMAHRAIRMKVWNFATKRVEKKATQNLSHFQRIRRKDLVSQDSCDMFWRRLDRTTFMGITGKQCLGYVKGEQVRITVSMTLTSQLLQTNEGWYRARDGKTLVEVDVPYNLLRTKVFPGNNRKKQKSRRLSARRRTVLVNSTQNDLPSGSSSFSFQEADHDTADPRSSSSATRHRRPLRNRKSRRLGSEPEKRLKGKTSGERLPSKTAEEESNEKDKKEKQKEWILPSFDAIAKALHSGHLVFYSVELSACTLPSQMKAERLSFGDFVDSFQSTHQGAKNGASIRFWQSKFVQGDEGMEKITREITIQSKGRVQVRLHRKLTDTDELAWDHSAQCRLFDPETGLGGVKMTSRPAADVHEITTFGRFRAALRRGRRQVRMVIDLTQCDGRTRDANSIMGTTVRAYDFINKAKAIEVSQLTPDSEHTHYSLLTGHFLNNGEVIFITSMQPRGGEKVSHHLPFFYHDSTYRCALSGSDVTKTDGPSGVRLFYTT